jgi:hypothetical protein
VGNIRDIGQARRAYCGIRIAGLGLGAAGNAQRVPAHPPPSRCRTSRIWVSSWPSARSGNALMQDTDNEPILAGWRDLLHR